MGHYATFLMVGRESRKRNAGAVDSTLNFPKQCDDREKAVGQFIIFIIF